jgi:hypothetical protein
MRFHITMNKLHPKGASPLRTAGVMGGCEPPFGYSNSPRRVKTYHQYYLEKDRLVKHRQINRIRRIQDEGRLPKWLEVDRNRWTIGQTSVFGWITWLLHSWGVVQYSSLYIRRELCLSNGLARITQ